MRTTGKTAHGRALRTLTMTLVLALLAALLLAGSALGVAKPGKPTAKAPKNTITTTKPTFTWSKASGAAKYELRVYQGSTQKLTKTGLTKLSYKAVKALPKNVTLTWKVRASNAAGAGAWSKSLTFTVSAFAIGALYQGGRIAYLLQSGDAGYDAHVQHGLIAATTDQSTGVAWSNVVDVVAGATGTAIGTGAANTSAVAGQPGCTSGAAYLCYKLVEGGYSDWYLPSMDELNKMYINQGAIGGLAPYRYWSSSEIASYLAWGQLFGSGIQDHCIKDLMLRVRAVRSF
jgi:hypothetical protein